MAGVALAVAAWAVVAAPLPRSGPKNVLLVTLDTTRADHVGTYGYFRDTTPNLDALAERGVVFERAIAPMSTTLPAHTSILTAVLPLEHGVTANLKNNHERFVPTERLLTFAQYARAQGIATAAFTSAAPVAAGTGLEVGFDVYDDTRAHQRDGAETVSHALAWLRWHRTSPFFVWVHLFEAHAPYMPHPGHDFGPDLRVAGWLADRGVPAQLVDGRDVFRPAGATNRYDAEIAYDDEQVGRLLAALDGWGLADDTAVVVMGDHGEGLGQHDYVSHGRVWDEEVHVPLIVAAPGASPRRVPAVVSSADVMPTLLGLVDWPHEDAFVAQATGRDALAATSPRPAFTRTSDRQAQMEGQPVVTQLTTERWAYQQGEDGSHHLFDLVADPYELADVEADHPDDAAALKDDLERWRDDQLVRGEALGAGRTSPLDPERLDQLRELGYAD